ncbi:hypothetical protein Tco_0648874 [Tanacetum coccineum]
MAKWTPHLWSQLRTGVGSSSALQTVSSWNRSRCALEKGGVPYESEEGDILSDLYLDSHESVSESEELSDDYDYEDDEDDDGDYSSDGSRDSEHASKKKVPIDNIDAISEERCSGLQFRTIAKVRQILYLCVKLRTILITVHLICFCKTEPEAPGKSLWDHLSKVFSLYDVRPSENDLIEHCDFIREAVMRTQHKMVGSAFTSSIAACKAILATFPMIFWTLRHCH